MKVTKQYVPITDSYRYTLSEKYSYARIVDSAQLASSSVDVEKEIVGDLYNRFKHDVLMIKGMNRVRELELLLAVSIKDGNLLGPIKEAFEEIYALNSFPGVVTHTIEVIPDA